MRVTAVVLVVLLMVFAAGGDEVTPPPLTVAPHDPVTAVATSRDGAIVEFDVVAYGGRDPNPTLTCNPPSGSLFPLGPTYVHCLATNSFGERDEGGVYVFVYDVGRPILTVPDDITVPADSREGAVVSFEATAEDVIDGTLPVTCSPESGSRFPVGMTAVECSATDDSYNTARETFTVHVTSDEPETLMIHVPDPITAEAEASFGATVVFTVTADGTSDPDPVITCDPPSGEMFPLGTTTVDCVARDKSGNMASDSFTVTAVDTTAPVLVLPESFTVPAEDAGGATVSYEASANDAVDGDLPANCDPPSGSKFPVGTTTARCTAADAAGNSSSGEFTVTVDRETDTAPPMIMSVSASPDELSPPNHKMVTVAITVEVMDVVDPMPSCAVIDVTSNQDITGDYEITGELEVQLRAERIQDDRRYVIGVQCEDASGNAAQSSTTVTVPKGNSDNTSTAPAAPKRARKKW